MGGVSVCWHSGNLSYFVHIVQIYITDLVFIGGKICIFYNNVEVYIAAIPAECVD